MVMESLDREQIAWYSVDVVATDSGDPPLSSSISIRVEVADENDEKPVFEKTSQVFNILENQPEGNGV